MTTSVDAITRLLSTPRWARAVRPRSRRVAEGLQELGLGPSWFVDHARDLAVEFAEPILRRRRAAVTAGWPELRDVWEPAAFPEDAVSAAESVWSNTIGTYQHIASAQIEARRLGWRGRRAVELHRNELKSIRRRVLEPMEGLEPLAEALDAAANAGSWEARRRELEAAYVARWEELGRRLGECWAEHFAPRLYRLTRLRSGPPRWAVLAAGALIALVVAIFLLL